MWRLQSAGIELLSLFFLGACRLGGTTAIAPDFDASLSPVREVDAAGDANVSQLDDASLGPLSRDASVGSAEDSACASSCKPEISVPSDCTRIDRDERVYLFCTSSLTWGEARSTCLSAGTDLVIIGDDAENAFVAQAIAGPSWIGANDQATEGSFVWVEPGGGESGAPVSYTKWEAATPDNCVGGVFAQQDCARISKNGRWNDSTCNGGCTESTFAFVCESY